jgi:beta-1,4-mannooligosaccharide/beta-1,4-mannosyl-N-acetylglucosamine phosphorylase
MGPKELYERVGDVPNVLFPCATLHDEHADRLVIYYGGADTVVAVAYAHLSEVISWTRQ